MNNEQRGVYIQVINTILDRGDCPSDPKYIGALCRCRSHAAKRIVGELIALGKLTERDGKLRQNRAETELERARKSSETARLNAEKRWKSGTKPMQDSNAKERREEFVGVGNTESLIETPREVIDARPAARIAVDLDDGFTDWYDGYPKKKAPAKALQAWRRARRGEVLKDRPPPTVAELIEGRDRYVRSKPGHYDWAYPASWLNAGRWADEGERSLDERATDIFEALNE